jgi:peptide deformylase
MMETMVTAEGIGLAGPQVGLSKRIFIASDGEMDPRPFINPEIIDLRGQEMGEEGCLSLPELYAPVSRAKRIKVRAQDPKGKTFEMKTDGLLARCIQHEYDHLEGVCFVDRVDILTRQALLQDWQAIRARLAPAPS